MRGTFILGQSLILVMAFANILCSIRRQAGLNLGMLNRRIESPS